MDFYLQCGVPRNFEGYPESRVFLDDHQHVDCELIRVIKADDWREAREKVTDIESLA